MRKAKVIPVALKLGVALLPSSARFSALERLGKKMLRRAACSLVGGGAKMRQGSNLRESNRRMATTAKFTPKPSAYTASKAQSNSSRAAASFPAVPARGPVKSAAPKASIFDEDDEVDIFYDPQPKKKTPKGAQPRKSTTDAPKPAASSTTKGPKPAPVVYPDNVELEISAEIKRAVGKKGKAVNPQSREVGSETPRNGLNEHLASMLEELGQIEKARGELYKYKAYATAVHSLRHYPKRVDSGEEAAKLPGVGAKIAAKIQQILDTDKLEQLDIARNDPNVKAVKALSRVSGIGPMLARKLVYEDGIKSIEELKNLNSLTHHQRIGLKYVEDFEKRIPREEMDQWNDIVLEAAHRVDPDLIATICGSYRRKLPTSGDVDVLMTHPAFKLKHKSAHEEDANPLVHRLVDELKREGFIVEDMALGPLKYMGVCKLQTPGSLVRRLDIKLFPFESYAGGLMHFTGSAEYNRQMRSRALDCGYRLNEYGLHHRDPETGETLELIPTLSEQEICELLDVPYKKPEERSIS